MVELVRWCGKGTVAGVGRIIRRDLSRAIVIAVLGFGCRSVEPATEAASSTQPSSSKPTAVGPSHAVPKDPAAPKDPVAVEPVELKVGAAYAGQCPDTQAPGIGVLVNQSQPGVAHPTRVLVATLQGEAPLSVRIEHDGEPIAAELEVHSGVPSAVVGSFRPEEAGDYTIVVGREGTGLYCHSFQVLPRGRESEIRPAMADGVWPLALEWNAAEEALFSAWVRELFAGAREEELAWKALHEVTSDEARNLLFDAQQFGEDGPLQQTALHLKPDCADVPYFLRAYYAWKRGLPFGFRRCSRGRDGPPRCGALRGVVGPPENPPDPRKMGELGVVQRFFSRTVAWGVHSGNGRTPFASSATDFYPVALDRRSLRPGTIYADPYGHLFVVVEWVPADGDEPGILYAIDGQPDGSITRKRFWEGNFLWNADPELGGSGFKAFRPHEVVDGHLQVPTNETLADFSNEQAGLAPEAFYDRMDGLITPGYRDPYRAQHAAVEALYEAAKVRVTSIKNAEAYRSEHGGVIDMPDGFAIFETTGAWENYSTPARDLRFLIAIDLVLNFGDKIARQPAVFVRSEESLEAIQSGLKTALTALLADPEFDFTYTRSDGSPWTLSLADVVKRAGAFEDGYNPNDCPEVRWGAPAGSDERQTCRRRAPSEQQRKMAAYRVWFKERRRPPRGDTGPSID